MNRLLLLAGIMTLSVCTYAQHAQDPYSISVFNTRATTRPNTVKIAGTLSKVHESFAGWSAETDIATGDFKDLYGPAIAISGSTIDERVSNVIEAKLGKLDVRSAEWRQTNTRIAGNAQYADYVQSFGGHDVVFSRLSFRFTTDGRLVRVQMRNYGQPTDGGVVPKADISSVTQDLGSLHITSSKTDDSWVWFPIPATDGYVLHAAWHYIIEGTSQDNMPVKLTGFVDATDNSVLYRNNEIKDAYNTTIKGNVYKDGTAAPATLQPLRNLALTIGGSTYYTDTAGVYNSSILTPPVTTTVNLSGKWSKVVDVPSGATPNFDSIVTLTTAVYTFPTSVAHASSRHINAYYHVNRVHDFMKTQYPTFTAMDIQLPTNIDVSGSCNAYYNGSSINFFAAGGGCMSFAEIGTVVYHEYGHGISDKYYNLITGGTIYNGALNEGSSDVWAMCVSHSPIIGENAYTPGTGYIRRYDGAPAVYPVNITGEVHNDGQIIAGAWWDVGVNLGSIDSMAKLFAGTYNETPDGPAGTEGDVYHQVLIGALINDDNDANLNNGTPHFVQIIKAFAKHGIYLLNNATLAHTELNHQPAAASIPVMATASVTYPFFLGGIYMYYKVRGTAIWDTVKMVNTTGSVYTGQIAAQGKGAIVDYYFAVNDTMNNANIYYPTAFDPTQASSQTSIPFQFGVGIVARDSNTFEGATDGWRIGNNPGDNATNGKWINAVPVESSLTGATGKLLCQTGHDHTTGSGKCLVTGNAFTAFAGVAVADVDNGKTTVLTPAFDLTAYTNPIIEYYRWYGNDRGTNPKEDLWQVHVRDTNSGFWAVVEQTYQSDYNWRRNIFALKEHFGGKARVQFRFTAQDNMESGVPYSGASIVEAAVDDFFIYDVPTTGVAATIPEKAKIYPNPANDKITVYLPDISEGTITINDLAGRTVSTLKMGNTKQYEIDTHTLAAGNYLLVIQSASSIQSQAIVVRH
ncbi:MAG: T9SS type A sorting domain-containing protein [Taibaiella sp.]|nr:T9SS type A sorting domain-containing protein [Taibaiella sp.]